MHSNRHCGDPLRPNPPTEHPVCEPSRVSLLTGWYPRVAGHRTLDNLIEEHEPNLFKSLRTAGYDVAIAGDRGDVFAPGTTESSSDRCGFLEPPDPDDRPWALWVRLIFPHPPFTVEEPWFSLVDRADMPDPIRADAAVGKPGFMEAYRNISGWDDLTADDFRMTDQHLFETAEFIYEAKARLQREQPDLVGTAMSLRTPTHTYVHRRYESDEFCDRIADPNEVVNVIGRAADLDLRHELLLQLLGWLADTSDVIPWTPNPRRPQIVHGFRDGGTRPARIDESVSGADAHIRSRMRLLVSQRSPPNATTSL